MDVSVEITTFNRKEVLRRVLEQLEKQTYPCECFEVVVSDDGSTDGLPQVVTETQARSQLQLRLLQSEHRGPGFAHNRGIEGCTADIVIMLASDVLPVPELVEEHVKTHREHPQREVVVAGRLLQSDELPDSAFQRSWNHAVNRVFAGDTGHIRHGGFLVNNISFKRDFLIQEGMFKEWPPAAQEDVELGWRLRDRGMRIIASPRALAYHYHVETLQSVMVRSYIQGYHWHYLEDQLPESWVRFRVGKGRIDDGIGLYFRGKLKGAVGNLVVNQAVVSALMVPLLKAAQSTHRQVPLTRFCLGQVAEFYFRQGRSDYQCGRPNNPPIL